MEFISYILFKRPNTNIINIIDIIFLNDVIFFINVKNKKNINNSVKINVFKLYILEMFFISIKTIKDKKNPIYPYTASLVLFVKYKDSV